MSVARLILALTVIAVGAIGLLYLSTDQEIEAPVAENAVPDRGDDTPGLPVVETPPTKRQQTPQQLTDAELRSAIVTVCQNSSTQTPETIEGPDSLQRELEKQRAQARTISNELRVSSSGEHLHVAALFSEDPEHRIALLRQSLALGGTSRFLVWAAVLTCSDSRTNSVNCPLRDWEQRLLQLDGQNSEAWVLVAANRFRSADYDAALIAMKHASTSSESRAYWTDMIAMFERGLSAATDKAFPERASMAVGFASSNMPDYGLYAKMCSDRSTVSVEWAYTCLAYGRLVEKQGKNALLVAIAETIQKDALESLGELEEAARIENRQAARQQKRQILAASYNSDIERVLFSSPALFYSMLDAIDADGETVALKKFNERLSELLKQEPELVCEQLPTMTSR